MPTFFDRKECGCDKNMWGTISELTTTGIEVETVNEAKGTVYCVRLGVSGCGGWIGRGIRRGIDQEQR